MKRLALGTVQFGLPYGVANEIGQVTRLEAMYMLQLSKEKGIDILDTAIAYGESEECLGEVGTQGFKLVTKLPAIPEDCIDVNTWVHVQVKESFARLGVSSVYGLLLHRSEQLLGTYGNALYQTLQNLKDSGQVQKIGISIYSPTELDKLIPNYHFDIIQAPFNLVDRRLSNSGWLQRLKDLGVEVHVRSAFLQGLLLMSAEDVPVKFTPWNELFCKWHEWLEQNTISAIQACLAYPLSFAEIDRVVIGADSVGQLEQIISASQICIHRDLPNLNCDDEKLINPACWNQL